MDMLVGAAATFLIVGVISMGRAIQRHEARTGKAWSSDLFLVVLGAPWLYVTLYHLDHPFWGALLGVLVGALASSGVIFLLGRLLAFLKQASRQ